MDYLKTFEQTQITKKIPDIRPGDTVRIHEKIKEKEKERIQVFEGTVIRLKGGRGMSGTITVRKITSGGIGVERTYPCQLPALSKIEVVKRGKVRRAKLYYLRKKQEKEARLKEKKLTAEELGRLKYEEKIEKKKAKPKKTEEEKKAKPEETKKEKKAKPEEKKEGTKAQVKKGEKKIETKAEEKTK